MPLFSPTSSPYQLRLHGPLSSSMSKRKVVVVGAGPVGSLAALYAASRGDDVEVYELRDGKSILVTGLYCSVHP